MLVPGSLPNLQAILPSCSQFRLTPCSVVPLNSNRSVLTGMVK